MNFQQAFFEINGYEATPEQVKHAIAVARIVKEADLDPILLVYLADAQAQAARERGAAEIRQTTKEAVEGLRNALPSMDEAQKSIGALAGVQSALRDLTGFTRKTLRFAAIIGAVVGALWGGSVVYAWLTAWHTAYAQGRVDQGEATHQRVCDGVNEHIASISAYLRRTGSPQAADKLEQRYEHRCR
jgi:hypothetical protein